MDWLNININYRSTLRSSKKVPKDYWNYIHQSYSELRALYSFSIYNMNNTETDSPRKLNGPDNADLEYILELFDSKELGLTIA